MNDAALDHMTDTEREAEIKLAGRLMEAAIVRYLHSSDLADRGDADRHRLRMEELIRGRSADQIACMQAAQAERMAREPGAGGRA